MNINKTVKILFPLSLFLLWANICFGQKDTVLVKQGDKLVGEMQSLDHDMLLFKTQYADGAIAIKWNEVLGLHAAGKYKVLQSNGRIDVGGLQLDTANKSAVLKILTPDSVVHIKRTEIQEISRFDKKLTDRLKIDADLGLIKTKANNADQASFEIALRYFAQRWEFDFDYSAYASTVDTIHTNRASVGLTAKYNFPENWFLITRINSFTSTEQMIDYRVTYFAGSGKYIIRHHRVSLWGYIGATYNREKYTIDPKAFKTAESFVGLHFESSPIERVNIVSEFIAYPSLSDWGRVRAYSKTDVSVTFARHFRFGLGYVLNSDNKPPVNSSKSDYLFNAKLGWSL
jgi:hypothetical protein